MNEEAVFRWPMILLPVAALAYFELMRQIDALWARRTPITDEERLAMLARRREISEHRLFHLAAAGWSLGGGRVEDDFRAYLKGDPIPHYVRDYLRRQ